MEDEIKEIKIGMYTTDEILEFMTNGEGRGFMGRSMYDAIIDYITNLQEENENNKKAINLFKDDLANMTYQFAKEKSRNEKAIEYVKRVCKSEKNINPYILHAPTLLNILNGDEE